MSASPDILFIKPHVYVECKHQYFVYMPHVMLSASSNILFISLMCMLSASTNILFINPHLYDECKHQNFVYVPHVYVKCKH